MSICCVDIKITISAYKTHNWTNSLDSFQNLARPLSVKDTISDMSYELLEIFFS